MRWTKGVPAAKAPQNVPLLVAFDDAEGRRAPSYAVMIMRREVTHYIGAPGTPDVPVEQQRWTFMPSHAASDWSPSRFWLLPVER